MLKSKREKVAESEPLGSDPRYIFMYHILVFGDGSKLPDGSSGAGSVIFQLRRQVSSGSLPVGSL